jgi:hypothetical protein
MIMEASPNRRTGMHRKDRSHWLIFPPHYIYSARSRASSCTYQVSPYEELELSSQ